MIKIIPEEQFDLTYDLIINSFRDIADELGASPENCPGNSAFMTKDKFLKLCKTMTLYGYYDHTLIGCVGLVKKSDVTYKIKMLSVAPDYRHKGIGRRLINHLESLCTGKLKLGMIYENQVLFKWYESLGFSTEKIKAYKGNKFRVAYMEKRIDENI